MSIVSCNQMAAITSQWWRRLVNAYEVKASMVCSVKTVWMWSIPERFRGELLTMGRYINLSTFTFTFNNDLTSSHSLSRVTAITDKYWCGVYVAGRRLARKRNVNVVRTNSALRSCRNSINNWKNCWKPRDKRSVTRRLLEIFRPGTHHVRDKFVHC